MIFMTMALALQPLYLRKILGLARDNAGFVNANIQVITELVDLLSVGYLGYLSDRKGRIPVVCYGFVLAGFSALLLPFSLELGLLTGVGGLAFVYLLRSTMSLGTTAVWPQIATLAGDFADGGLTAAEHDSEQAYRLRPRLLAKAGFMMAFGATLVYAVLLQIPQQVGVVTAMLLMSVIAFAGGWLARRFLVDVAPRVAADHIPFAAILQLIQREKALRLSFFSAFTSRNDMVIIGLFLMTWAIYFADVLGLGHAEAAARAGVVIGFIGLMVLLTVNLWGELIVRLGRVPAMILGLCLSGVGFAGMGLIVNPLGGWVFVPAFLVGVGQAGCLLAPQVVAMDLAPVAMRGSVLGVFNTVGCLGIIFFLQVGGLLFDWLGPNAPFVFTGIANFIIMFYGLFILKTKPDPGSEAVPLDAAGLDGECLNRE
ncbi:MAG: MFS transporter [Magnetococcales bacterium]|nr:MFS transporter [Magnetococcales bacterium]